MHRSRTDRIGGLESNETGAISVGGPKPQQDGSTALRQAKWTRCRLHPELEGAGRRGTLNLLIVGWGGDQRTSPSGMDFMRERDGRRLHSVCLWSVHQRW